MDEITGPWARAFDLAWESMLAGTTPVGCVVLDRDGQIVASGRGRRYSLDSIPGQLSNSHLAHAELNALAQLHPSRRYEDYTVLTTLEPCLLCLGAAVMATVGRVEYAGRDPYGGAAHLTLRNAHTMRMMPLVVGPADGILGTLGALLHYAFYVERDPTGMVTAAYREAMPGFVAELDRAELTRDVLRLKSSQSDLAAAVKLLQGA